MKSLMYAGEKHSQELICKFSKRVALTEALKILKEQGKTPPLLQDENFSENSLILMLTDAYTDEEKTAAIKKTNFKQLVAVIKFFIIYQHKNTTELTRLITQSPVYLSKEALEDFIEIANAFKHFAAANAISRIKTRRDICSKLVTIAASGVIEATGWMMLNYLRNS